MQAICEGDSSAVNFGRLREGESEQSGIRRDGAERSASVTQMNSVMSVLLTLLLSPASPFCFNSKAENAVDEKGKILYASRIANGLW